METYVRWLAMIVCLAQAAGCHGGATTRAPSSDAADTSARDALDAADHSTPATATPDAPAAADAANDPPITAPEAADGPVPSPDAEDAPEVAPTSPLEGMGTVELVRGGFAFVEGARWVPALSSFLLSDPYGETIYKLTPPSQFDPYRTMSNGANALDLDPTGHLVTAECGSNRCQNKGAVTRRMDSGVWADAITNYQGLAVANPNDIAALPDGSMYFSDTGLARQLCASTPTAPSATRFRPARVPTRG